MLPYTRRFLKTYIPGKGHLYTIGLLLLMLNVGAALMMPDMVKRSIDILLTGHALTAAQQASLRHLAFVIIGIGVALTVFRVLYRIIIFIPGRRVEAEIRQDYFEALTEIPAETLSQYSAGDLISRGVRDPSSVRVMLSMGVLHISNILMMAIPCLVMMIMTSPLLTVIGLAVSPVILIIVKILSGRLMKMARKQRHILSELYHNIREILNAHMLLAVYPVFSALFDRFLSMNRRYRRMEEAMVSLHEPLSAMGGVLSAVNQFVIIAVGGFLVLSESYQLSVGELVAFTLYLGLIEEPLRVGGAVIISLLQNGEVAAERLYDILDAGDAFRRTETQKHHVNLMHTTPTAATSSLIAIHGLSFAYDDTSGGFRLHVPFLEIQRGRRYGIFGPVGSGKTTLIKILAGSLKAQRGTCFFEGRDYADIPCESLMQEFSIVPQESRLFARTIRQNLDLVASHEAERGNRAVLDLGTALEISQIQPDLDELVDGIDSLLGENGVNLSGGQKQRLSLVRALIKPHSLLILDDIVSSIDHATETRLLRRLYDYLTDQTLIFISHRISALQGCDEIWILEAGQITARGTHEELMRSHHVYCRTFEHQVLEQSLESTYP